MKSLFKVFFSEKTGVNMINFNLARSGGRTILHLDGVLYNNCFFYNCVMHVLLVETVISWEQTIRFSTCKVLVKTVIVYFFFEDII